MAKVAAATPYGSTYGLREGTTTDRKERTRVASLNSEGWRLLDEQIQGHVGGK
jgi:hypothetical protein